MTAINTSNALGARVLRHFPFNGTEGEIVAGTAVTLGTGGSYVNDATHGWQLVGNGTAFAASTPSLGLAGRADVTLRFPAMISSTQVDGSLFSTTPDWDGTGGGFLAMYSATKLTIALAVIAGTGVVYEFPIPSRDVRHTFEIRYQVATTKENLFVTLYVDNILVAHTLRNTFGVPASSNPGLSVKPVQFFGWPTSPSGKGYMEEFTIFDGALSSTERASLASDPNQIYGTAATGTFNLAMSGASYGAGLFGQALTGGYGAASPSPLPANKTKDFYIQFRFKRGSTGAGAKNVILSQAGVATVWLDNTGNPQFSSPGGNTSANSYNFFDNQFHYGLLRFIGTRIELYIDGAGVWGLNLDRATNSSYNPTSSPLLFGAEANGSNPFGGAIDMVAIGLGDAGTAVPQNPTNTKQPGLIAVYAFDGNGFDTAGTAGTLPNGDLTTSDLQGQRLVLSGTTYNGVTKGTAYIFPASSNSGDAEHKSADMVIFGTTWTATFEAIAPGSYSSKKMDFFNDANQGVSLTAEGFSIIPISGGGDLSSSGAGADLAATTLTLTGLGTATVNVAVPMVVSTDNPLSAGETKTVALTSPNGVFTPSQVTLTDDDNTADVQYVATSVGAHTLTASTSSSPALTSATKAFTATAVVVTPPDTTINTRTVTLTLVDRAGTPRSGLSGIKWAFFDAVTADLLAAPASKGSSATTNASGVLTLSVQTALATGATGFLILSNSAGNPAVASDATAGAVTVV